MGEERKIRLVDWKLACSLPCNGPWVSEVLCKENGYGSLVMRLIIVEIVGCVGEICVGGGRCLNLICESRLFSFFLFNIP